MEYRTFPTLNDRISLLGFGLMRLPKLPGSQKVDYATATQMIELAMQAGVNYYDTAYVYHAGDSELFVGEVLSKYPRESYFLADKLPTWMLKSEEDVHRYFDEQLKKCSTDYFDYYLVHSLSRMTIDKKMLAHNVIPILKQKQKEGKIRHLGFSFHDDYDTLAYLLSLNDWDFGQLQINYLDWEMQNAEKLYQLMEQKGVPTIVMEPVRGGVLANLGSEAAAHLHAVNPAASQASWALRFVAALPNVCCTLSGMSNMEQVIDNLATFADFQPLSEQETKALWEARDIYRAQGAVPCTACQYCMPCPAKVNIPNNFFAYNHYCASKDKAQYTGRFIEPGSKAENCTSCGACVEVCPQHIDIPAELAKIAEFDVSLV